MKKIIIAILSVFIAFVFVQSLPFKFSNSLETKHIFSELATWSGFHWVGDYGGYIVGIVELVASLMLLVPVIGGFIRKKRFLPLLHVLGAVVALGTMTGAIYFHLFTPLGIAQPQFNSEGQKIGENSLLFMMACITWFSALAVIVMDFLDQDSVLKKLLVRKN